MGAASAQEIAESPASALPAVAATSTGASTPAPVAYSSSNPAVPQQNSTSAAQPSDAPNTAPPPSPNAVPLAPLPGEGFFDRWGRAYLSDWTGNAPGTEIPQQARRGTPAPISSPPFPASDWPIGGTPVIGSPDTQSYPLMQAINENKSVSKIFGWIEVGANGSTNNKSNAGKGIASNAPAAYDVYANTVQLDQAALYFTRLENTAQTDHVDWGYQLTLLYGVDYRFTTAKGILSQQLLLKNSQYGFDPVMFYIDGYFPHVAQGLVLRVGRYISLPDIEAQLAPNNYTYSHSILYTYDCYTQTGINATVKFSKHWTVQGGLSGSCDVAPWTPDAKLTGNVCLIYTWHEGGDALNTCDNSINDSKYAYNNLTAYYTTYYHKINAHWHTDTEAWYQYEKQTPNEYWYNSGGTYSNTPATPYPETTAGGSAVNFGAVCQDPKLPRAQQSSRCFAPEWAVTNYLEREFHHNRASLNIRNEFVYDIKGQRTGTPAKYEEHLVGLDLWTGSTVTFRPELSYLKCYSTYRGADGRPVSCTNISAGNSIASYEATQNNFGPAIPSGLGKTQYLTLAADIIYHF